MGLRSYLRRARNQQGKIFDLVEQCGFSGLDYIRAYPDLLANLAFDNREGIRHFVQYGAKEERTAHLSIQWDAFQSLAHLRASHSRDITPLLEALSIAHIRPFIGNVKLWQDDQARAVAEFRKAGGSPILIFGDSHASLYAIRHSRRGSDWLIPVDLKCIGASARGLAKVPSISGNGEAIRRFVAANPDAIGNAALVLFKFGQVDLEFVYYYNLLTRDPQAKFDESGFASFISETIARYVGFLEEVFREEERPLISLASVFPPCLSDDQWATGYLKGHIGLSLGGAEYEYAAKSLSGGIDPDPVLSSMIRKFDPPSLSVRTRMHRLYNNMLEERCRGSGFRFINDFDAFLGPDGLIDPVFTARRQGTDHHIDASPVSHAKISEVVWRYVKPEGQRR